MAMPKQKWDRDRMEMHPPHVPEPYSISRGKVATYVLMNGNNVVMPLRSQSEHGAHREAMEFIKLLDF